MTLEGDDEFDGGEAIDALTPQADEEEEPMQEDTDDVEQGNSSGQPAASSWQQWYRQLQPLLGYLPTGEYEEDTERDGLLSYSVEVHVFAFGISAGIAAVTAGNMQIMMSLVTLALGLGRFQQPQTFTETVREQVVKEPAYALGGVVLGYIGAYYAQTGQLPPI